MLVAGAPLVFTLAGLFGLLARLQVDHNPAFGMAVVRCNSILPSGALSAFSSRPPVIRYFLIVQVSDASDQRRMALTFRPINRFLLRIECPEHMVRMVFDDIILDSAALRAPFWACLDVNISHDPSSIG